MKVGKVHGWRVAYVGKVHGWRVAYVGKLHGWRVARLEKCTVGELQVELEIENRQSAVRNRSELNPVKSPQYGISVFYGIYGKS